MVFFGVLLWCSAIGGLFLERRLAAILDTDMAGYSRLMEADEAGFIKRQKNHRRECFDPEIQRNRGIIIKTTGDGLLVQFVSASDAVRAAIEIQIGMMKRELNSSEDERIRYRVGINVGDVVFDDGDVFGDGVNVASRLEGLAEPRGVCLSDSVNQMVQDGLSEPFNYLGIQKVKNISVRSAPGNGRPIHRHKKSTKSIRRGNNACSFALCPTGSTGLCQVWKWTAYFEGAHLVEPP